MLLPAQTAKHQQVKTLHSSVRTWKRQTPQDHNFLRNTICKTMILYECPAPLLLIKSVSTWASGLHELASLVRLCCQQVYRAGCASNWTKSLSSYCRDGQNCFKRATFIEMDGDFIDQGAAKTLTPETQQSTENCICSKLWVQNSRVWHGGLDLKLSTRAKSQAGMSKSPSPETPKSQEN